MTKLCYIENDELHFSPYTSKKKSKLYIEITSNCNLKCKHCFNNSGNETNYLAFDNIIQIYQIIKKKKLDISEIILSGGEPTLHPELSKILTVFAAQYPVKLLSNGANFDQELISIIKKYHILTQLTLNGAIPQTDSALRGENGFNKTISTIKKLVDSNLESQLIVTTSINQTNKYDLENIINLLIELGVKNYQLTFVYRVGRANTYWDEIGLQNIECIELLQKILYFKTRYANNITIRTSGIKQFSNLICNSEPFSCFELNEEICIDVNGNIMLCPRLKNYLECQNISSTLFNFKLNEQTYKIPKGKELLV